MFTEEENQECYAATISNPMSDSKPMFFALSIVEINKKI